jgi:hypothetical protein
MARKPSPDNPPCPRCGATHGIQNGSKGGRPRWVCRNCQRSFGPTLGTAMDRWRAPCGWGCAGGGRSAAEEITGHKDETIPQVLVHDLHWSEVEVDAFGSFVQKSLRMLEIRPPRRAGWARVGDVGVRTGRLVLGWRGALGLRRMRSRRRGWRRPVNARRVGGA